MRYFISFLASVTVLVITANYTHCATNITEHLTKAHALYDRAATKKQSRLISKYCQRAVNLAPVHFTLILEISIFAMNS